MLGSFAKEETAELRSTLVRPPTMDVERMPLVRRTSPARSTTYNKIQSDTKYVCIYISIEISGLDITAEKSPKEVCVTREMMVGRR